jgi:hypothetical protein
MINIWASIFGKVIESAEGILDEVITTKEEKETIKLELKKIFTRSGARGFRSGGGG